VIGDRAYREGDALPEFNVRVHRIHTQKAEFRPLEPPLGSP